MDDGGGREPKIGSFVVEDEVVYEFDHDLGKRTPIIYYNVNDRDVIGGDTLHGAMSTKAT
jgi:hypothetical protein